MAITVNLYTFSKKSNSTKRPTGDGTTLSCELRDATSILAPEMVFKLNSAPTYNYMYVSAFSRYYYINDWTYDSGFWIASCKVDSLASHKTAIGNSTQYVVRSSHSFDGKITDTLYPLKSDFEVHKVEVDDYFSDYHFFPGGIDILSGTYIIGVSNGDAEGIGSITYYAMNQSEFNSFKSYLMDPVNMSSIFSQDEISDALLRTVFNPMDYIKSCVWVPFKYSNISGTASTTLKVGWWTVSANCKKVSSFLKYATADFTISNYRHELASTRGNYLLQEPYTEYKLLFPPFGVIPLDASLIYNSEQIHLSVEVDIHSGDARLIVTSARSGSGYTPIVITDAKVGIEMSLLGMSGDFFQMLGANTGSIGQGIISGFSAIAGAVNTTLGTVGLTSGVTSPAMSPEVNGNIALNTLLNADPIPELLIIHRNPVSDDNADNGRPLMQRKKLADIPGYIVCQHGDIAINCSQKELDEIGSYLTSGFFYE